MTSEEAGAWPIRAGFDSWRPIMGVQIDACDVSEGLAYFPKFESDSWLGYFKDDFRQNYLSDYFFLLLMSII